MMPMRCSAMGEYLTAKVSKHTEKVVGLRGALYKGKSGWRKLSRTNQADFFLLQPTSAVTRPNEDESSPRSHPADGLSRCKLSHGLCLKRGSESQRHAFASHKTDARTCPNADLHGNADEKCHQPG